MLSALWVQQSPHGAYTPVGGMLDVVATRQDLTAPAPDVEVVGVGLSDHSLLQWSDSSARPTPVIEETFTGHQRLPVSNLVCSVYRMVAWPRPRHDGVTL